MKSLEQLAVSIRIQPIAPWRVRRLPATRSPEWSATSGLDWPLQKLPSRLSYASAFPVMLGAFLSIRQSKSERHDRTFQEMTGVGLGKAPIPNQNWRFPETDRCGIFPE